MENLIGGCSDANVKEGVPFRRTSIGSNLRISLSRSLGIFPCVSISRNSFNLGLLVAFAFWVQGLGFWGFLIRLTIFIPFQDRLDHVDFVIK